MHHDEAMRRILATTRFTIEGDQVVVQDLDLIRSIDKQKERRGERVVTGRGGELHGVPAH